MQVIQARVLTPTLLLLCIKNNTDFSGVHLKDVPIRLHQLSPYTELLPSQMRN